MKSLLLSSFLLILISDCYSITIADALKQKQITLEISTNNKIGDSTYHPSFYKECMLLKFKNLTNATITFTEPAGRFFQPDDTSKQRMILTKQITFVLKGYQQKELPVFAMCTEAHDGAPSQNDHFYYGAAASGNLLKLVQMISNNNFQDDAAQSAIWCITDGYSAYSIDGNDTTENSKLRKFVCDLKGEKLNNQPIFNAGNRPHFRQLEGHFEFTIAVEHTVDIKVFNDKNELIATVINHEKRAPGKYSEQYELKIPVEDDSNPPVVFVKFYLDQKLISNHKYEFKRYGN